MTTENFKKYVLPHLPYLLIFWIFDKLGQAYRIAAGVDFGAKLLGMLQTVHKVFVSPAPSLHTRDLLVGLVGTVIIYIVVYVKGRNARKFRKDIEYGSARWGTAADIKPYMDPKPENNIILTKTEGLTMSSRPKNPKHARNKNMLVVGGSGSGKTRFVIKPNLMQCQSKDYPVSFVVTDPKGSARRSSLKRTGTSQLNNYFNLIMKTVRAGELNT